MRFTLYAMQQHKPEILSGITVPEGINKDALINAIMRRSGDLFPRVQNPDQLSLSVHYWFDVMSYNISRMLLALNEEYNPIENYDRKEDWTDDRTASASYIGNSSANGTATPGVHTVTESKVSAYNSNAYEPKEQEEVSRSGTDATASSSNEQSRNDTQDRSAHSGRVHGNIGVTTNAQMIEGELALRIKNLYDMIAKEFEKEFISQVY